MEEVKGEFEGKPYHGIVYFAIDGKGRKKGNPIKSSLIGKMVGADALKKRCGINTGAIKKQGLKQATKELVSTVLNTVKNKKQFKQQLKKQGIDVVFRENKDGRIYGVTFIDHRQRTALNGSRLGKEFSANVLNERLGEGKTENEKLTLYNEIDEKETQSMLFSFLDFKGQGEDYEEEAFIRRIKRKKRRKRKI